MTSEIIDLSQEKLWEDLLTKLPHSDIYFSPKYYRLAEENGEGQARCFVFRHQGHLALYPFLINSVNRLGISTLQDEYWDIQGAYGYNGVLTSQDSSEFRRSFYEHFDAYCRLHNIIAEFTRFHPLLQSHNFSSENMEVLYNRQTLVVDLKQDYQNIWTKTYNSNNRNMIRKAQKNGFTTETLKLDADNFYKLYTQTMSNAKADDFYFFGLQYFYSLSQLRESTCQINIYDNQRLAASLILLFHGKFAHYHLAARDVNKQSSGAANLALDEAIKISQNAGCHFLHLGGGYSSQQADSLFRFKNCFTNERCDFFIGKKVHNYKIYNTVCEAWEKAHPHYKDKFSKLLLKYRRIS